jgi:hypothetical protein
LEKQNYLNLIDLVGASRFFFRYDGFDFSYKFLASAYQESGFRRASF